MNAAGEPFHFVSIKKAHDVRSLRQCNYCQGLGHNHMMVTTGRRRQALHWHGRCYIRSFGMPAFLELPEAQTDKITIGDIEIPAMKQLMTARARKTSNEAST